MHHPHTLSKSKLVAFRQCPKRLWLEVHQPHLRQDSAQTQAIFQGGHEVGAIAQRLFDPEGSGQVIDFKAEGLQAALRRTQSLLQKAQPVFEAGFSAGGALAFADVMLPEVRNRQLGWRMVEVKSSTSVKAYQDEDVAIQSYVALHSGVRLHGVSIAHVDSTWVYPGAGHYQGLLVQVDRSESAFQRHAEVKDWIAQAQAVAASPQAPAQPMGEQCQTPFACGFATFCSQGRPQAQFPVGWLPGVQSKGLKDHIREHGIDDLQELPQGLLTPLQKRVQACTVRGEAYFDAPGARQALAPYPLPAYFLDFETAQFTVPRWAGTRPFEMLPFQFSVHRLDSDGTLTERGFLDLSGQDPRQAFAEALVEACPEPLPVFVYNAGFEGAHLATLARHLEPLRQPLLDLRKRLVDLLPICRNHYYHPGQQGSWSIKKVLPTLAPHLDHARLEGVQDGGLAMQAYREAIDPATPPERKAAIEQSLVAYCALDTLAMVEIWRFLVGSQTPLTKGSPCN